MNRCTPRLTVSLLVSVCALLEAAIGVTAFTSTSAIAQTESFKPSAREFPSTALRGEMVVQNHPDITLNGKAERLSPGARIFAPNNALVMSATLANQTVLVNYLRDSGGQINQVWLLNAEEAKEKRAGSSRTIFNFITDTLTGTP